MKTSGKTTKPAKTPKTVFFCTACGNEQPRWFGHCPNCGEWNTAAEAPKEGARAAAPKRPGAARWAPGSGATRGARALAEVELEHAERAATGMRELDRVLGGGIVPGSL